MLASGIGAFCVHSFKSRSHYWWFKKKKIILSETPCRSWDSREGQNLPPPLSRARDSQNLSSLMRSLRDPFTPFGASCPDNLGTDVDYLCLEYIYLVYQSQDDCPVRGSVSISRDLPSHHCSSRLSGSEQPDSRRRKTNAQGYWLEVLTGIVTVEWWIFRLYISFGLLEAYYRRPMRSGSHGSNYWISNGYILLINI